MKSKLSTIAFYSSQEGTNRSYTTRLQISKDCRSKCILCNEEGTRRNKLYTIATDSVSICLKKAVDLSNSAILKIRLSACSDFGDPNIRDILYMNNVGLDML